MASANAYVAGYFNARNAARLAPRGPRKPGKQPTTCSTNLRHVARDNCSAELD